MKSFATVAVVFTYKALSNSHFFLFNIQLQTALPQTNSSLSLNISALRHTPTYKSLNIHIPSKDGHHSECVSFKSCDQYQSTPTKQAGSGWVSDHPLRQDNLSLTYCRLKKGASVELWVEREPYMFQGKEEKQELLFSVHTALIRHFSNRWKRELAATDTKRVSVPFFKEPTKLVLGWMVAGGGSKLGTLDVPYPKGDLPYLKILKDLATHLEIDSLAELIEKDLAAVIPVLPPVPAAGSAPAPATKKDPHADKVCFFCGKRG